MGRADSPLRDRLVFLVGARRSGTNWLERILTAHPSVVAMRSETYLFSHGVKAFAELVQHANPGAMTMGKTFMERDRFLDASRALIDEILLDNLDRLDPNARYLVERTPWHACHLPLIADVYPDARAVHIVRDGRAVARSLVSMDWGPKTIEEAAAEWRDAIEGAREGPRAFGDGYREVRYEDVLSDPRARTADLFAWLDLELSDKTWDRVLAEAASEFNVDPGSPGVRTDKWREDLSEDDVDAFERVAGPQLELCGYELAAGRRSTADLAPEDWRQRLGRVRSAASGIRRPRAAAGAGRMQARQARRELQANYAVAESFQSLVADGADDDALALVAPHAWVRLVDDGAATEGRGEEAARELLRAVAAHRELGLRPLTGEIHVSPTAFTTTGTYALADGSRWASTLVMHLDGRRITRLALYRFRLYM
jgi:Sulfotransferase family